MSTDPATRTEPEDDPREGPRPPGVPPHQPPLPDGHDEQDRRDEEAEQSFPSSDPPATGGPGI
ncbi:MAG: hypothetical protein JHC74_14455 [Thermoleophilia bacterium]|nr:hypothetical protein [Thermoleophilia bacterium]